MYSSLPVLYLVAGATKAIRSMGFSPAPFIRVFETYQEASDWVHEKLRDYVVTVQIGDSCTTFEFRHSLLPHGEDTFLQSEVTIERISFAETLNLVASSAWFMHLPSFAHSPLLPIFLEDSNGTATS